MKYIIILFILCGCSSRYHLNKAIKKEPTLLTERIINDTIQITRLDSIPYAVNDTIHWRTFQTVTDTLIQFKYKYLTSPKTKQDKRLKSKMEKRYQKEAAKLNQLNARLEKRLKAAELRAGKVDTRSKSKMFYVYIGLIISFILYMIIRKFV